MLEKVVMGWLKLVNKLGLVIYGFIKFMVVIEKESIIVLFYVSEISVDIVEKLDYKFWIKLE